MGFAIFLRVHCPSSTQPWRSGNAAPGCQLGAAVITAFIKSCEPHGICPMASRIWISIPHAHICPVGSPISNGIIGDLDDLSTVSPHDVQFSVTIHIRHESDVDAIGGPDRRPAGPKGCALRFSGKDQPPAVWRRACIPFMIVGSVGYKRQTTAIDIDPVQLVHRRQEPGGLEVDAAIGRKARLVTLATRGDLSLVTSIGIHRPHRARSGAAIRAHVGDQRAVGRPGSAAFDTAGRVRQSDKTAAIQVGDKEVRLIRISFPPIAKDHLLTIG